MIGKAFDAKRPVLHVSLFDFLVELVKGFPARQSSFDGAVTFIPQVGIEQQCIATRFDRNLCMGEVIREAHSSNHQVTRPQVFDVNARYNETPSVRQNRNFFFLALNDQQSLTTTSDNTIFHTRLPFLPAACVLGGSQVVGTLSLGGLA